MSRCLAKKKHSYKLTTTTRMDTVQQSSVTVFEFHPNETTAYTILSHWWNEQEVNYDEMVELVKTEENDEIRQRFGYKVILGSCEQAKRDGCKWLWVDICCIDKCSSADLSEVINSTYRWYEKSRVCYAYLHDVRGSSLPVDCWGDRVTTMDGWVRTRCLVSLTHKMIAPNNVQFFNNDWQPIGNKRTFSYILSRITRVPQHILRYGLSSNSPCVVQIMLWAANRTTTRVEDGAYSLLGLLDVNMPALYGEGKKAFHPLQLDIIRTSNDQSIFT
ncbi:hypothetical protein V8B97DRAFT_2049062 [Scleroderma yunnanense]